MEIVNPMAQSAAPIDKMNSGRTFDDVSPAGASVPPPPPLGLEVGAGGG